ncbi:MAG: glycosyltransferase family 2 protein [Bdellovibrionota bacterium]
MLPALNERDNLEVLLPALLEMSGVEEVILVDDRSEDGTVKFMAGFSGDPRVQFLQNPVRLGVAGSIFRGLRAAKGTYVLVRDSDLNHQLESVRELILLAAGGADFVIASRYRRGDSGVGRFNDIFSFALNKFLRALYGEVTDWTFGFFLVKKSKLKGLPASWIFRGRGEFTIRLYRWLLFRGVKPKEIFTAVGPRGAGKSTTRTFRHGWSYLRCLLDWPPPPQSNSDEL